MKGYFCFFIVLAFCFGGCKTDEELYQTKTYPTPSRQAEFVPESCDDADRVCGTGVGNSSGAVISELVVQLGKLNCASSSLVSSVTLPLGIAPCFNENGDLDLHCAAVTVGQSGLCTILGCVIPSTPLSISCVGGTILADVINCKSARTACNIEKINGRPIRPENCPRKHDSVQGCSSKGLPVDGGQITSMCRGHLSHSVGLDETSSEYADCLISCVKNTVSSQGLCPKK